CFQSQTPTWRALEYSISSRSSVSLQRCQNPSTRLYSKPSSAASRENCFMVSSVFSPPPSRYFQTARPGLTQSVWSPCGKYRGSGGGERSDTMSQFTSVSRFDPIITTRHGVVIVPETAAGCASRAASAAPYRSVKG